MIDSPIRPSKQILVTGMHRAGTSFFSSWLRGCGMFMGEDLIGPTPSNQRGYSEDRTYVELHELLLKLNNTNLLYSGNQALVYTEAQSALLTDMVSRRGREHREWAVKQPRAALFLPLWNSVLPDAHYIFLVRHPLAVINSLLKRESNRFLYGSSAEMAPRLKQAFLQDRATFAAHYARAYLRTYAEILAFIEGQDGLRYMIVPFEEFTGQANQVFHRLTSGWGFSLTWTNMSSLFDEGLLTMEADYLVETCEYFDDALEKYRVMLMQISASTVVVS